MTMKKAVISGKLEVAKRALTVLGLCSFLAGWAVLGIYGLICLIKKFGWIAS
jgi:hypothetical protein